VEDKLRFFKQNPTINIQLFIEEESGELENGLFGKLTSTLIDSDEKFKTVDGNPL
jgi:hypothetical protein